MNVIAVFNFLLIAGAVQGFIFNIATFLARKKVEKPVLFLNLFVLFLSLNNLQSWLIDKGFFASDFFLNHFRVPWYVLIVPMFYAFLVYYLEIEKKKWPFLIPTLLIFLAEIIARTVILVLAKRDAIPLEHIETYNNIEDAVTLAYSVFLYIKSIRIVYKHDRLYRDILKFDNLNWVKVFLKLGGVVIFLWLIAIILNSFSDTIRAPYSYYPLRLASSVLIYWVGYQAFFQYVILQDRIGLRKKIRKKSSDHVLWKGGKNQSQETEKDSAVFANVDQYIKDNQRYLDPYLSMEKVAEELEMGTSTFSKLINQHGGKNFPDYINALRVETAKKLLRDNEFTSYTIVAIGLECGFNSKSTFYSAFKKFTGKTPTEYRKHPSL